MCTFHVELYKCAFQCHRPSLSSHYNTMMNCMIYLFVAASLFVLEFSLTSAGYCNPSSTNCGAPCSIQSDCPNGDCWAEKADCGGGSAGYCNPSSTNCGAPCNSQSDCPNGDCWADKPDCGGESAGYCSPSLTNCGAPCNIQSDCPDGDCWTDKPDCGDGNKAIFGTYIGAYPGGLPAPQLSDMAKSINLVMLSFSTDSEHNGKFT